MNANALRGLYRLSVEATEAIEAARDRVSRASSARAEARAMIVFVPQRERGAQPRGARRSPRPCSSRATKCASPSWSTTRTSSRGSRRAARRARRLVYLYPDENGMITRGGDGREDRPAARRSSRAAHVSNVLGIENPVKRHSAERVHAHGGYLVVDGAQSVPHLPVDVTETRLPTSSRSRHTKRFGPFGMGVLWGTARPARGHAALPHGRRDDRHR